MTNGQQMILGMHLGNGYGSQGSAWRAPGRTPRTTPASMHRFATHRPPSGVSSRSCFCLISLVSRRT